MNPEELKRIAVLQAMDSAALSRLADALEEQYYADGQTIFAEGDPGESMYFIADGCVRIEKRAQTADAAHKTLAVLEAGDYLGEMALLDQKPRSAAAVSTGKTRLLRLSKAAYDQIQQTSSPAAMSVLFAMIRTSSERIRRLSTHLIVYDEVGKAIGEAPDLNKLLDVILRQLANACSADWALLLLRSQFSDQLEIRAQLNLNLTSAQNKAIGESQGFLGPILREPQDILISNAEEHDLLKSCPRLGIETPSLLLSPITVEGQFLGLIVLGGNQPAHFDLNALNLVRGVGRQAGQAIQTARHREEDRAKTQHSRQYVRF